MVLAFCSCIISPCVWLAGRSCDQRPRADIIIAVPPLATSPSERVGVLQKSFSSCWVRDSCSYSSIPRAHVGYHSDGSTCACRCRCRCRVPCRFQVITEKSREVTWLWLSLFLSFCANEVGYVVRQFLASCINPFPRIVWLCCVCAWCLDFYPHVVQLPAGGRELHTSAGGNGLHVGRFVSGDLSFTILPCR